MSANHPGETRDETVSQGGGFMLSFSGGVERSEPESLIQGLPAVGEAHARPPPLLVYL